MTEFRALLIQYSNIWVYCGSRSEVKKKKKKEIGMLDSVNVLNLSYYAADLYTCWSVHLDNGVFFL